MKTLTYEPRPGMSSYNACQEAVVLANREGCNVEFDFNEQKMTAAPGTDPKALAEVYFTESERRQAEYMASPEYKRREKEAEQRHREENAARAAALITAPAHMTLRDPEAWRKSCEANKDGYGGAVMTYAERWARLMEARMVKGERLADIAKDCSHLADEEGITGFMYGCAVSTLANVWIHGEALRLWHNLDTQIGTEGEKANQSGGVLNPAILNIGTP